MGGMGSLGGVMSEVKCNDFWSNSSRPSEKL